MRVRVRHLNEDETRAEIARHYGTDTEVSDAAAVTIASWWQSPGGTGSVLAALSTGASWDLEDLLDDIASTRAWARAQNCHTPEDDRALDMLATWAINRDLTPVESQ